MALLSRKPRTEDVSDPAKLLIADHQKVERLFDEIKSAEEPNMRQGLVAQLAFELDRHTEIEEQILYPFIRQNVPGGDGMMDHAEDEHGEAKRVLAEVRVLDVDSPAFAGKLKKLEKLVQGHVKEEEKAIFPSLEESTDAKALSRLRGELERAKLSTTPNPSLPAETRRSRTKARTGPKNKKNGSKATAGGAVLVRKRDDGTWEVRREHATRASRLFTNKREAETFGRGVAKREDVTLDLR